jgi:Holliday junction resolvase RusA-like endonuclease
MPMPKSWSIKKNETKFLSPHRSTPDIDNLFKAFTDTVFYTKKDEKSKYNDSEIYSLNAVKIRDDE